METLKFYVGEVTMFRDLSIFLTHSCDIILMPHHPQVDPFVYIFAALFGDTTVRCTL